MKNGNLFCLQGGRVMRAPDAGGDGGPGVQPGDAEHEKREVELKAPREAAGERERELARREAEVTRRELRAQALETLAQRQLPAELAQLLDYEDAARCSVSLERAEAAFRKAVQKGVESRVAGKAPRAVGPGSGRTGSLREAISGFYGR